MNIVNKVTLKFLLKNKTRTIVTIIGVILSAAMITAVTTLIVTMQSYAINLLIAEDGDWHAALLGVNPEDAVTLAEMDEIDVAAFVKGEGYSCLEGGKNVDKPYLYVVAYDEKAFETLAVNLILGRLPENENEIVISKHILTNAGINLNVGDVLNIEIGDRVTENGLILDQSQPYMTRERDGISEEVKVRHIKQYTVVGLCSRPSYTLEGYTAPGYTVITKLNFQQPDETGTVDVYIKAKNPRKIYELVNKLEDYAGNGYRYNSELLRFMGISNNNSFNKVLYSLGAILIVLIIVGSISLIYNSFSISVSERKRQFGLLSGAGATSRQLRNSVFFEALVIAGAGIPLGILSGVFGIFVTLRFVGGIITGMIASDINVPLVLRVSPASIAVTAVVALVTILISAYIPARRSSKISAMDAIRQTQDIRLTGRQVKTLGITRKLFGIEGDLALKNMKRNRKRYRSTVISLFISIVLFVSASAYSMYLKTGVESVYEDEKYDISYYLTKETLQKGSFITDPTQLLNKISSLDTVDEAALVAMIQGEAGFPVEKLNESYYREQVTEDTASLPETLYVMLEIYAVDEVTFENYVKTLNLDMMNFIDPDSPAGIIVDRQRYYDAVSKKFRSTTIIKDKSMEELSFDYWHEGNKKGSISLKIAGFADEAPFGIKDYAYRNTIMLIISDEVRDRIFPGVIVSENMYISAAGDPVKAEEDIEIILEESGYDISYLFNIAEIIKGNRNVLTVISVFAYGFIVLISLITIANVFNTISTNVNLRRREFAMLKSVGMTNGSFNKMINYESIFYGLKALLYGIPVSILVTWFNYRGISEGVDLPFKLPVRGILVSVASVFVVVFASMMYSMKKIRKENILDALKNENL